MLSVRVFVRCQILKNLTDFNQKRKENNATGKKKSSYFLIPTVSNDVRIFESGVIIDTLTVGLGIKLPKINKVN